MNFEQRALRARHSGAAVRAAVLLIEGLKRHPAEQSALELLCEIYVEDIDSTGLEYDLITTLLSSARAPGAYFARILDALRARDKEGMGRELIRVAADEGWALEWPPPRVEAPVVAEPEAEVEREAEVEPDVASETESETEPKRGPERAQASAPEGVVEDAVEDGSRAVASIKQAPSAGSKMSTSAALSTATVRRKKTPKRAPLRPSRRALLVVGLIVCVGVGALWWWSSALPVRGSGAIDAAIEASDPALKSTQAAIFGEASSAREATALAERRAFVAAVHAADWGAQSTAVSTRETVWGLASAATARALHGDFEQALSESARLERQYPGALATYWARGFVAEARGRFADALRHYLAGQQRYPQFAPFLSAQFRIALRQARVDQALQLQQDLAALSPENPYLHLEVALPSLADLEAPAEVDPQAAPAGILPVERPRFVQAIQHLHEALSALQKRDEPGARAAAEASLKAEPALASALMLAGVLRAGQLDVAGADAAWAQLAQTPGMSMDYRWALQIAAPRTLAAAGRPDLAYKYIVPVKALGKVDPREARQVEQALGAGVNLPESAVPLVAVESQLQEQPLAAQAIVARAEVLNLLGLTRAAAESLELLDALPQARVMRTQMRVRVAIRDGDIRRARALAASLKDTPQGDGARAQIAFYSGDYQEAIARASRALEHEQTPEVLRAQLLSQLALGHGRLARSLLEAATPSPLERGAYRALKMRVERGALARTADAQPTDQPTEQAIFSRLLEVNPTSVERLVDLANHAFWQKDFAQARTLAELALRLADTDPGAHWVMGLVEHISGQESAADAHFRAAWRQDPADPLLLIEMGRMYLGMGKGGQAQRAFYRALLRDRSSIGAIDGLGQAYQLHARARGVRDLSRILEGYQGAPQYVAQALETLRWLAILSGSRDGKEAGLQYLQRAVSLIGETADLTLELAHYHAARGDTEAARKYFARTLEKDSTRADARIGLARMAIEAGDAASAAAHLRRYLQFAPGAPDAAWARETLKGLEASSPEPGADQDAQSSE